MVSYNAMKTQHHKSSYRIYIKVNKKLLLHIESSFLKSLTIRYSFTVYFCMFSFVSYLHYLIN